MRGRLLTALAVAAWCRAEIGLAQEVTAETQGSPSAEPSPFFASAAPTVQTLQQALELTYQANPTLMAQRAELRRLDSGVALARAPGRPQIGVGADFSQEVYTTREFGTRGRNLAASADVSQVVFAGGRIRNSVQAAKTRVIAGRADLRAIEGELLTEAIGAYADVLRDREILGYNLNQVQVLEANLVSTRERFRVMDLTKTDVAQSEARLASARSNLATAEGRLRSSEENFERVVGARAGMLEPLPSLPPLPSTADQAAYLAVANNADVAAFVARARAAGHDVAATRAERWPTISAVGFTTYTNALGTADEASGVAEGTLPNSSTNVGAGLSMRLPLYQGGAAGARVRQAEETKAQLAEQAIGAERLAVAGSRAAFATWQSAMMAITANEAAVAANVVALESIKIEQVVGSRSILDVLNAEQELLNSQIALAGARRDAYVAAYELLNIMGEAEADDLDLDVGLHHDPGANYRKFANAFSDWADGPPRTPASTRTVPSHVNGPVTRLHTNSPNEDEKRP